MTEKQNLKTPRKQAAQKKPKNLRMLGSNIIQLCIFLTTGKKVVDPTSGMRLFGKEQERTTMQENMASYMTRCFGIQNLMNIILRMYLLI